MKMRRYSMTNRFLISVAAAALIAGTGFANAQGSMSREGGAAGGSTLQQGGAASERGAPSAAPMNRDTGPSGAAKGAQSDKMERGKSAQSDKMEGSKSKSAQDGMKGKKSQDTASDSDRMKGGKDMKAEGRDGKMNAETKSGADSKSQTTTTGQAGAGAKLSTEQRTKITSVIKQQNVAPVTNVNFSISVGTRVPRDVRFHTLPADVVTIYPQWRGYRYILVREEIVIVDPNTFEIVAIINA
jgi:hypothetical protein